MICFLVVSALHEIGGHEQFERNLGFDAFLEIRNFALDVFVLVLVHQVLDDHVYYFCSFGQRNDACRPFGEIARQVV